MQEQIRREGRRHLDRVAAGVRHRERLRRQVQREGHGARGRERRARGRETVEPDLRRPQLQGEVVVLEARLVVTEEPEGIDDWGGQRERPGDRKTDRHGRVRQPRRDRQIGGHRHVDRQRLPGDRAVVVGTAGRGVGGRRGDADQGARGHRGGDTSDGQALRDTCKVHGCSSRATQWCYLPVAKIDER